MSYLPTPVKNDLGGYRLHVAIYDHSFSDSGERGFRSLKPEPRSGSGVASSAGS